MQRQSKERNNILKLNQFHNKHKHNVMHHTTKIFPLCNINSAK